MIVQMYNRQQWVLAECTVCGRCNYVEPHGTTAKCCLPEWTEHAPIAYTRRRGVGGLAVEVDGNHKLRVRQDD